MNYRRYLTVIIVLLWLVFVPSNNVLGLNSFYLPSIVPTFHSMGITLQHAQADEDNIAAVQFRPSDTSNWIDGMPLWYSPEDDEYRGSLVHLTPGTRYEIKLTLSETGETITTTASTWAEEFPIAHVIELPTNSSEQLTIEDSGTPDGYVLVTSRPNETATIDAMGEEELNIHINASYVIIRGLTLKNAGRHSIYLDENAHDVVIENNDISGWGRIEFEDTGFGLGSDAAIYANTSGANERIIIQRNTIHHPRSDTNSWGESRPDIEETDSGWHPSGPQAIHMTNPAGNLVIRYNEIFSDDEHQFNDCIGGSENFSTEGFPNRDSDIYGNYLSHCWDNSIEAEGGNRNVRIWGNYTELTYHAMATRDTSVGPLYIWRNVMGSSRRYPRELYSWDDDPRGSFHKSGGESSPDWGVFVFHNTVLQPDGGGDLEYPIGARLGLNGEMNNTITRNNILDMYCENDDCISIDSREDSSLNDFDFDLVNGVLSTEGIEPNGIVGRPTYFDLFYDYDAMQGDFTLDASSLGYDQGVIIPNFNAQYYTGDAPDIGAHEANTAAMEFGVSAYTSGEPYSIELRGQS